jgi:long-chain acyl-CoA synthetase
MSISTLPDILRHHARTSGDKQALVSAEDGRTWTFGELNAEANRVAAALTAAGVGNQDRIAFLDKNAPEYFTYLYGGAKLGAVTVAVNWRLAAPEIQYILDNSEAKVLLIGSEFLGQLNHLNLGALETIVVLGNAEDSGHPTFEQWLAGHTDEDPGVTIEPDATCYQLYTSGTTGLPKGVELTHDNFLGLLEDGLNLYRMSESTVNLVCMPLFHIAGSGWGVVGQYFGGRTIVLRDVDVPLILRLVPEQRVTHAMFVPAVLQFMLDAPGIDTIDFESLELILYGASPITEEVLVRAMDTFRCDFMQGYGLTETTGVATLLPPEDHDPGGPRAHLLRSCGQPPPGTELRIVDTDTGASQADGEVGEIWIRGRHNMKGYWRNPDATRETVTEDGWLRTGDAGYLQNGYLFIHDRVKDMIISGGENIYPAEVENALMKHPGIADAAVIGVPSERWGETVKAIVTRKDDDLTEEAIIEHCRGQLARFKCPTSVDWMAAIPRNPSGKILKKDLRAPYWEGQSRGIS